MNIRRWEFSDNKQIEVMEKEYFPDPWNFKMLTETVLNDNFVGFVLDDEGVVKGYIGATYCLNEAEIILVAVSDKIRREGYATKLLNEAEKYLSERGVDRLLLEVRRSNYGAQKCYVKFGFSVLAIRQGYYSGGEDALVMEKRL